MKSEDLLLPFCQVESRFLATITLQERQGVPFYLSPVAGSQAHVSRAALSKICSFVSMKGLQVKTETDLTLLVITLLLKSKLLEVKKAAKRHGRRIRLSCVSGKRLLSLEESLPACLSIF